MTNWRCYLRITAIHVLCMTSLRQYMISSNHDRNVVTFVDGFTVQTLGRQFHSVTSTIDTASSCLLTPNPNNKRKLRIVPLLLSSTTAEEEETAASSTQTSNYNNNNILHTADTLDGRLLCAAQCAYDVTNRCYFRGVGFKAGTVAKRITRGNINSVLIGQTMDGIVISFRGTEENSPLDWLQNAALFLSEVDILSEKVKLHTGFYRAVKALWKPLTSTLREFIEEYYEEQRQLLQTEKMTTTTTTTSSDTQTNEETQTEDNSNNNESQTNMQETIPPPKIYLTGHSKGGALASIAAIMLCKSSTLPDPTYVCTFASAKPGNTEFRDYYNKKVNQTSYEAYLDIIPFLPPAKNMMSKLNDEMAEMVDSILWSETTSRKKDKFAWDYQTVGERKYIDEDADIFQVSNELDDVRIKDIEDKTFLSLKKFRSAHCSACPAEDSADGTESRKSECDGLYFASVAPEICDQCTL